MIRNSKAQPSLLLAGLAALTVGACVAPRQVPAGNTSAPTPAKPLHWVRRALSLPGAAGQPVLMDYLACDRTSGVVWVPAGNTASVDVIDERSGSIDRIEGFPMLQHELFGKMWNLGPSAVAVGDGVAYVGNRGDSTICVIDAKTRKVGPCIALGPPSSGLASSADGLAYVATTKELWVTMGAPPLGIPPPQLAITVFDATSPRVLRSKTSIPVSGIPEGYGVDEQRGIFYTNLEEKDRTVAIDVRTHRVVGEWSAGCGSEGPRGLAVDPVRNFVFVACTDRVIVLDAGHEGRSLGTARAGDGIDNIDYLPERNQLYVAAGKAALLTVFQVDDRGALTEIASTQTAKGARVVVAGADGTAYVADSAGGQILAFQLAP